MSSNDGRRKADGDRGTDSAEPNGPSTAKRRRSTRAELDMVDQAIIDAVQAENPVTLRGVYYRVVSAGAVEKTENGYRLIGREVLKLRRAGVLPYDWITDGTRWISKPASYTDLDEMLNDAAASYRRMLWHDQAAEVHVFTEKDAISGVVSPVTARWDVPLGVLRGYTSESFAYSMAQSIIAARKPVYVYQLGDHDPSGLDAWRDFRRKVASFLADADHWEPCTFQRIAVTPEQITEYGLLTRPTKKTDSRAKGFDGESVEVDAIPPRILRELVENAIVRHIDPATYRLHRAVEQAEREQLFRLIGGRA